MATLIVLPAMFELLGSRIQRAETLEVEIIAGDDGGPLIPEAVDPVVVEPPSASARSKSTGTDDA